jgi:hypothetical protein
MLAVAVAATILYTGASARRAFQWSWRAVARQIEWRNTVAFANLVDRTAAEEREQLKQWRGSRQRIAQEYRAEAEKIRTAPVEPDALRRASDFEQSAESVIKSMNDSIERRRRSSAGNRKQRDALANLDSIDIAILAAVTVPAAMLVLFMPVFKRKRAGDRPRSAARSKEPLGESERGA